MVINNQIQGQPIISVIVPIYNVEKYLEKCVDSLLDQDIFLEVILINDGSTDSSGDIVDSYQKIDKRVKIIHQKNQGLSAARNIGLKYAKGEYVIFVDSDDWIERNSLKTMYNLIKETGSDMIIGGIRFCYPNGNNTEPFKQILEEYKNKSVIGKIWFSILFSHGTYYLMACNYMYKREWLIEEDLMFENVIHEDELWTPVALSKAKKIVIVNNTFYNYRQRSGSIMHSLVGTDRLKSLLYIGYSLAIYSQNYTFEKNNEFKSWLWLDIYRIYFIAFDILCRIKDSSFILPKHHLYVLPKIYRKMDKNARMKAKKFYLLAKQSFRIHIHWRNHSSIKKIYNPQKQDLVLLYNIPDTVIVSYDTIPEQFFVTTDRKYFKKADSVFFNMSDLFINLEDDLNKPDNQHWVAWLENENELNLFLRDEELHELFDGHIIGCKNIDFSILEEKVIKR